MITVVGLGFRDGITLRGLNKIKSADKVILRTALTAPSKALKGYDSLDHLYEKAENFDELNSMIADELLKLGENCDLVYCVDGDGYKDSSVVELSKRTEIEIIPGAFDLAFKPSTSCLYVSAYEINQIYPDPIMPICIYSIDDANIAGDVKLFLLRFYAPDTNVILANAKSSISIPLEDLDRQKKYSCATAVYVEGGNNSSFADLLRILIRLTAPNGCPWDKAQTHESIRINLLEEAYEAVDAITNGNIDGMIEELGDVLMCVVNLARAVGADAEMALLDTVKKLQKRYTAYENLVRADGKDVLNLTDEEKTFYYKRAKDATRA